VIGSRLPRVGSVPEAFLGTLAESSARERGRPGVAFVLLTLVLPGLLAGWGCVSSDDIEGLHRQMNDIEKQIQALERKSSSKEEVAKLNANVSEQTRQLLKSNADTGVKLNELTSKMEQLEAKLEDTNRRLSQLSQQIAETQGDLARLRSSGTSSLPPSGKPGTPGMPDGGDTGLRTPAGGPTPSDLYDTAYGDYSKGRYALAIQGFQDYLKSYPNTDLSDDAQYWIGESHYAQKNYKEAVADFDKLLKDWPKSNRAPAGLLKKAYALLELGQKPEAVVQLQYVMHEYPTTDEARLARAKLKSLGIEAR
jgi:tol-pal system protein YbgF